MINQSQAWFLLLVDVSIKVVFLALFAAAGMAILRVKNNHIRHRVWTVVLLGMLLMPALVQVVPSLAAPFPVPAFLRRPTESVAVSKSEPREHDPPSPATFLTPGEIETLPNVSNEPTSVLVAPAVIAEESSAAPASSGDTVAADGVSIDWHSVLQATCSVLIATYFFVTFALAIRLLIGMLRATKLANSACGLNQADIQIDLPPRVLLCESDSIRVPITVGYWKARVILPVCWRDWSDEKLAAVLQHEMAHIARGDCLINLLAEWNRRLYWFHPLAGWLIRRLSDLAERNCDDAVIASTGDRISYASHLLEIAASAMTPNGRKIQAGASMARSSNVETRIDAILDTERPLAKRVGWRGTLLLFTLVLPVVWVSAALRTATPQEPSEPVEKPLATAKKEAAEPEKNQERGTNSASGKGNDKSKKRNTAKRFTVRGRVVDSDGKAVPKATVYVVYSAYKYKSTPQDQTIPDHDERARTRANAEGHFEMSYEGFWFSNRDGTGFNVVAIADGFAPAWITARDTKEIEEPLVLRLQRESQPLAGRVVDLEGQPIPGVTVTLKLLGRAEPGSVNRWLSELPALRAKGRLPTGNQSIGEWEYQGDVGRFSLQAALIEKTPGLSHQVVTGQDGRFQFDRLGNDRLAVLELHSPTIVTSTIQVLTRTMKPVEARGILSTLMFPQYIARDHTYFGTKFDFVAAPCQPIEGVVRDKDTDKPVAGVRVVPYTLVGNGLSDHRRRGATTDRQGRFRITGMPTATGNQQSRNQLKVIPQKEQPYFARTIDVPKSNGLQTIQMAMELKRGVWVTGRLTDRETGEPIKYASFDYFPLLSNSHAEQYNNYDPNVIRISPSGRRFRTEENGMFRVLAIPGKGILTARCGAPSRSYRKGFGATEIDVPHSKNRQVFETYDRCIVRTHHALRLLDIAEAVERIECSLEVDPGQSLEFELFDPDGKPLEGAEWRGLKSGSTGRGSVEGNRAVLGSLAKDYTRTVIFYHLQRQLGLAVTVNGVPDDLSPRKIKLLPCATLTGRILDADTSPVNAAEVTAEMVFPNPPESMTDASGVPRDLASAIAGSDGRFRYLGLVPGLKFNIRVKWPMRAAEWTLKDLSVEPGEEIDLGDIDAKTGKRFSEEPPIRKKTDASPKTD